MIGSSLGPYRVVERLGSGGMGSVYLAVRGEDQVAVKVFHPHLLEQPGFFRRFQREAEAGRRIRSDGVVRTLDCDFLVVEGRPCHFLVMEYVEGITLRETLEDSGPLPEALLREIARQVAGGLRAIHAEGIVHRDLKPENVLITGDDEVKIMDLGVALLRGEAIRLSVSGQFVGSVLYASPEQFRSAGGDVDERADLYSLGLILYELATGELPCFDGDVVRVIELKLEGSPRRLGEVRPHVSPFFEEVVHVLMEKDRGDRFQSADEVVEVLTLGEASPWWQERSGERPATAIRPGRRIRVARETSVHGRSDEIEILRRHFGRASEGAGQVVLLEGEAGVGKTRLVDALVGQLEDAGVELNLLYGSYPPGGAATAAGALCTAYREHLGSERLEEGLGQHLGRLPSLVPAFVSVLRGEPAPSGCVPLDKDATQTAFVEVTRSLASERVTIVVIDDLHLAPEEGRALFAALAWAVVGHRVLLIGATRPGLPEDWIASLTRLEHVHHLYANRLTRDAVEGLLRETLGSADLAKEFAPVLARWSDGNPFFVFEILRGLEESGVLVRKRAGSWTAIEALDQIAIPASVQDLITSRIAALDEDERSLLDAAACAGFEFDPVQAGEAVGLGALAVLRRLSHLERTHRLVRSTGERFAFDHHLVREALYDGLPSALRKGYHAALAESLERRLDTAEREPADLEGDVPVLLCSHFLMGGRGARALRYLTAALDHLESNGLNVAALEMAERAIEQPGLLVGAERASVLLRAANLLDIVGRWDEGGEAAREASGLAEAVPDPLLRIRAARLLGAQAVARNRTDEAEESLRKALELAREAGCRDEEAAVTVHQGNLLADTGRVAEARACYERALEVSREIGSDRQMGRAIGSLGVLQHSSGDDEGAAESARRSAEAFRRAGDRLGELRAQGLLSVTLQLLGETEAARAALDRQLEIARETGYRRGEAFATGNLGWMCHLEGRYDAARRWFERAFEMYGEIGDRRGEGLEALRLGCVLQDLGRFETARTFLEHARALARENGHLEHEQGACVYLARNAEGTRRPEEGMTICREAIRLAEELGDPGARVTGSLTLGRLQRLAGRMDEARESIHRAVAIARENELLGVAAFAAAHGALVDEHVPPDVAAVLDRNESELDLRERIAANHLLWLATGEQARITRAHRILEKIRRHLGEDARRDFDEIPLHAEILRCAI